MKPKAGMKSPRARRNGRRGKRFENKERTRNAILDAALKLFSQKGFYRTTTKAISTRAGIAEGTLFNYFRTKEDLALYFFERELNNLIEWFEADKRMRHARLPEQLFAIVHRHLERIGPYEEFIGAVTLRALQPVSKLSPLSLDSQSRNLRYLRFIREILVAAEDRGEIPAIGDIGSYAFGLFHLAVLSHWLQDASDGKENTLALLDRSLKLADSILKKGRWDW
jgi:AcrR family transcriptional regulator